MFCSAIEDNILNVKPIKIAPPKNRIIAWGALGKNARELLPELQGTALEPTELWDTAGDGVLVKNPDLAGLAKDDTVLVLPSYSGDIPAMLETSSCGNVLLFNDIITSLSVSVFPEFYDSRITFKHCKQGG